MKNYEKKGNVSQRLNKIIRDRNLRQVDVLKMCEPYSKQYGVNISKGDLSTYISGKTEPRENKIFILAKALGVSETWLMGFDVLEEKKENEPVKTTETEPNIDTLKVELIKKILFTDMSVEQIKQIGSYVGYITDV